MHSLTSKRDTTALLQATTRSHGFRFWITRILLGLLALMMVLAASGAGYEAIMAAGDATRYPPPGRLVDVGGYRLHINCGGAGSPTVVLEGGMFASSSMWAWAQPELAQHTRVCAYDRAGLGWSDSGSAPRDARQIADELHTLLANAGETGPFVLVGHSLGGVSTRVYAVQYSDDIAGVVLVEATHPEVLTRLPAELAAGFTPPEWQLSLFGILGRVGVARAINLLVPDLKDLPPAQRSAVTALNLSTRSLETIAAEMGAMVPSLVQARAAADLGATPLLVLSAEATYANNSQAQDVWGTFQQDLTTLSSNSVHQTVPGTTHDSLV
jgi:pimeloyl-ACP methyl ester carboxylesterase